MAPLFKELKGVNFSCASPASAAICTSIDRRSMVRPRTGRAPIRHASQATVPPRRSRTISIGNSASHNSQSSRKSLEYKALDLLGDDAFFDDVYPKKGDDPIAPKLSISSRPQEQVVVLRVSLHCKGCEGKVRKHISKMEGVRSFTIESETKKVTVVGDVTPSEVLNSVSKVKNAQFWP
ncbi:uncharacterized protein [Typha angustifolia]|uniref:uncharacterized protein n=1 Tax=Typha angustifolia TaxID=59011 RepID=UPI003C3068A1